MLRDKLFSFQHILNKSFQSDSKIVNHASNTVERYNNKLAEFKVELKKRLD